MKNLNCAKMVHFDVTLNDGKRTWTVGCYAINEKVAWENIQRQECDHMGVKIIEVRRTRRQS